MVQIQQKDQPVFVNSTQFQSKEGKSMSILMKFLAGAVLVIAPVAAQAAECAFVRSMNPLPQSNRSAVINTATTVGQVADNVAVAMMVPEAAHLLKEIAPECRTTALLSNAFLKVNDLTAGTPVSGLSANVYLPAMIAPAPQPAATVSTPVAAVKDYGPQLLAVQAELATERGRLDKLSNLVADRPQAASETAAMKKLSEKVSALESLEGRLKGLEASDKAQNILLGNLESGLKGKASSDDVKNLSGRVDVLEGILKLNIKSVWFWLLLAGVIVVVLCALFGLIAYRRRGPDLSGYATKEDLAKVEDRLDTVENRFTHSVKKIDLLTIAPAAMKDMTDDTSFMYRFEVDGATVCVTAQKVGNTPSGAALIKVDVLGDKPVAGPDLFRVLAGFIEKGGVVPILKRAA